MSLESFYGGRQGASFVIVKHFDGIDIPQPNAANEYTFTGDYYAVDSVQRLILLNGEPIKKESSNQGLYSWAYFKHDASVPVSTNTGGVYNFTDVLAEGMVQCFEKGATSASEVNYGEYVIIDTIVNMHNKNDIDNGKVYRRGMDYQAELAGAEYIGQIVGPQGETPEVDLVSYADVIAQTPHKEDTYNPVDGDIIPGSYIGADGARRFEDEIKYAYATMKDANGNVIGCELGFKIPTLVQDFVAYSISPYENRVPGTSGFDSQYTNLIYEDPEQYIAQKWQHPFYQKWQIKVPQGYHGVNSTDIEIVPTETKPAYAAATESFPGATVYSDAGLTDPIAVSPQSLIIMRGDKYNANPSIPYAIVQYGGVERYVKKEDCQKYIMRYRETNFDNVASGEVRYIEIGSYNSIDKVTMSENGILTVFYTSDGPEALDYAVRWIEHENTQGITIDDDGTVHIYFNTLDSNGNREHYDYPTVLDWVQSVTLSQDGQFKVLFNNNSLPNLPIDATTGKSMYQNTLNWIDYIDVTEDGVVNFYYNTDHTSPIYTSSSANRIKYVKNIKFNSTDGTAGALEGSGDQKFVVTYNTRDYYGNNEVEDNSNWAAMNYIIETKIYYPIENFGNSDLAYHLIAIFSDPAYRAKFTNYSYPSDKLGVVYDEWVDLGYVRGEKGGFHTVAQLDDVARLKDDNNVNIPPEAMKYAEIQRNAGNPYVYDGVTGLDWDNAGWGALVTETDGTDTAQVLYFYDYSDKIWYKVGEINIDLISPDKIVMQCAANDDMEPAMLDNLNDLGFWFATETMVYAN